MTDGGAGPTPGNAVPTPAGRFNHLDAVRAAAMISVVTVHSLMSLALGFPWIVTDAERGLFGSTPWPKSGNDRFPLSDPESPDPAAELR
ncbi:MAG: hypothetical protein OXQ94_13010 [Gemmatimonadota bacterium]|nr:hypothetical protein [Gemmatimonadota bacterium]MDE2872592.1 hypothetical protein [Gemmatimonadota bacterium]